MTRMGGGFGLRAYGHYIYEAALISKKVKAPIKLIYSREDDMTYGIYRPMYTATYRAALDANKNLIAFHVKGGGIPEIRFMPTGFLPEQLIIILRKVGRFLPILRLAHSGRRDQTLMLRQNNLSWMNWRKQWAKILLISDWSF